MLNEHPAERQPASPHQNRRASTLGPAATCGAMADADLMSPFFRNSQIPDLYAPEELEQIGSYGRAPIAPAARGRPGPGPA
jgi:hypothetical protein